MNADPAVQLRLLDLQALDATLDRLAARRRSLPEHAELEALQARLAVVRGEIVRAETEAGDLARDQNRIEADVEVVRSRMARDQSRLDSGQVGSPRELESLQSELVSLRRRRDDLEDQELEIMERRETAEAAAADGRVAEAALLADRDSAASRRDAAYAEIDAEAARARAARDPLAAELPADLVALYEKIRASSGGVGAAALFRGRCEGCRLSLPPSDLAAIKAAAPDEVLRCEECRRILVRTPESGL